MPIKVLTSKNEFEKNILNQIEKMKYKFIIRLCQIGEECIKSAREFGSYKDQTGNLRSSIGYIVIEDGKIINLSGFGSVAEGASQGQSFANELASKHNTGIVLIIVAGMNYAVYVSAKGYNVIDSSELIADNLMKQLLKNYE